MNEPSKPALHPLFASPIMVCGQDYAFSSSEQEFFDNLELVDNAGNRMSRDTHVLGHEALASLRAHIDSQILLYRKKLLRIQDANTIFITQSWVNVAGPGQFHPRHKHPNSLISGVLFISDNGNGGQPAIRFHRAAELFPLELLYDELNEFNATSKEFDPARGRLILFPSLLEHDVPPNRSGQNRISLSFNTFVSGTVGGVRQLTRVELGEPGAEPET